MDSNALLQQQLQFLEQQAQLSREIADSYTNRLSTEARMAELSALQNEHLLERTKLEQQIADQTERIAQEAAKQLKQSQETNNVFKKMATGGALGAVSALGTTISTVFKIGKVAVQGFVDVLSKITGAAFNIGKSLLMLPWNMFKSFVSAAASGGGSNELLESIEHIRKEFGGFNEVMGKSILSIATLGANMKNMAVASLEFYSKSLIPGRKLSQVWLSLPAMMKDITETLVAMGPTLNNVIDQFKNVDDAATLVAMQKGLGFTKEEFKGLAEYSFAAGKTMKEVGLDIAFMSQEMADKFGLDSKLISKDVGKMAKDIGNFGNLSAKELTSVATYTQKLGIETSKLLQMMDKFDQFEDAADSASKLSQAFGVQVDSMDLMMTEDPTQRYDLLRSAFDRAGVSSEGMRRQSLKLLASQVGVDAATAKTLFSTKNLGKTYDEVKGAVEDSSKKQIDQTEVLKRLADSIEKVHHSGNMLQNGFFKTFLHGLELGIQRTPAFVGMMANLRRGLRETLFAGMGTGKSLTSTLGLDKMFDSIGEQFGPKEMGKFWNGIEVSTDKYGNRTTKKVGEGVSGFLKKIFDPKSTGKDIDKSINNLIDLIKNKFNLLTNPNSSLYTNLGKLGAALGTVFQKIFEGVGKKIGEFFKGGAKWLKSEDIGKGVEDAANKVSESPWAKFLIPVWEGIKSAFLSMFDGFAELAPVILGKIISAFTWIFKGIQYFLSDDKQRKQLDIEAGGSFLGMGKKQGAVGPDGKKSFSDSFSESADKLTSGIQGVFNDEKLWGGMKAAFKNMWNTLEPILSAMFEKVFSYAWEKLQPFIIQFLLSQLVIKTLTGALSGAGGTELLNGLFKGEALGVAGGFAVALTALAGAAELARGAFAGVAEAKDIGRSEAESGVLGALTGSANAGSALNKIGVTDKGSAADRVSGAAIAVGRGALVGGAFGAALGSIIPGAGTAAGAILGAKIGAVVATAAEGYKQSTIEDKESSSWKKSQADIAKSADKSVNSVTNETQPTNTITQQSATADQMQQAINNNKETNKIIDKTQKSLDDNTESLKNLTSTNVNQTNSVKEDLTINIDKVKVNLDKLESNLLTGINSIKATMQNVNVQVAVAVELNVADLEKAIVRQNSSLIRKAVQIIENNLPSNPNTTEKSGEAKIVTAAFKGA